MQLNIFWFDGGGTSAQVPCNWRAWNSLDIVVLQSSSFTTMVYEVGLDVEDIMWAGSNIDRDLRCLVFDWVCIGWVEYFVKV